MQNNNKRKKPNYIKWSHQQISSLLEAISDKIADNPQNFEVRVFTSYFYNQVKYFGFL